MRPRGGLIAGMPSRAASFDARTVGYRQPSPLVSLSEVVARH